MKPSDDLITLRTWARNMSTSKTIPELEPELWAAIADIAGTYIARLEAEKGQTDNSGGDAA